MLNGKDSQNTHLDDSTKFDLRTVLHAIHNAHIVFDDVNLANTMDSKEATAAYVYLLKTALYFGIARQQNEMIINKVKTLSLPFAGHEGSATVERFYVVQPKFHEALHRLAEVDIGHKDVVKYIETIITTDFLRG